MSEKKRETWWEGRESSAEPDCADRWDFHGPRGVWITTDAEIPAGHKPVLSIVPEGTPEVGTRMRWAIDPRSTGRVVKVLGVCGDDLGGPLARYPVRDDQGGLHWAEARDLRPLPEPEERMCLRCGQTRPDVLCPGGVGEQRCVMEERRKGERRTVPPMRARREWGTAFPGGAEWERADWWARRVYYECHTEPCTGAIDTLRTLFIEMFRRIEDENAAPLDAGEPGEPVAWMCEGTLYLPPRDRDEVEELIADGFHVVPLYASPAPVEPDRHMEGQVREAIAILENGTEYERMHVVEILRSGLHRGGDEDE